MNFKVTNTQKHVAVGFGVGFIYGIMLLSIAVKYVRTFHWVGVCVFFLFTLAWEYKQYKKSLMKFKWYWLTKGFDSCVDIVAGNFGFNLSLTIIVWNVIVV